MAWFYRFYTWNVIAALLMVSLGWLYLYSQRADLSQYRVEQYLATDEIAALQPIRYLDHQWQQLNANPAFLPWQNPVNYQAECS